MADYYITASNRAGAHCYASEREATAAAKAMLAGDTQLVRMSKYVRRNVCEEYAMSRDAMYWKRCK